MHTLILPRLYVYSVLRSIRIDLIIFSLAFTRKKYFS